MTDTDDHPLGRTASRRQPRRLAPVAAGVAALGLCCGVPLLVSLGAAGVITGFGVGSWLVVAVASVVAMIGVFRWRRRRECDAPPARTDSSRPFPGAVDEPAPTFEARR